jgi:cytochrome P450
MTSSVHEFGRYHDVRTALADRRLAPQPAQTGPAGSVAWLRTTVARFSTGEIHARRRALVEADLRRLDPAALRRAVASGPDGDARLLPVRTLAEGLGFPAPDAVAQAIAVVAGAYFGGENADADAAVAWLLPRALAIAIGDGDADADDSDEARLEAAANRIGLLVQAHDATGRLIEHARQAADGRPAADRPAEALLTEAQLTETLLTETLRYDPPVRVMRRVATGATRVAGADIAVGDLVVLDIAAANRDPEVFTDPGTFDPGRSGPPPLTFGSEPRICPGRDHAMALAAGILLTSSGRRTP